MPLYPYIDKSVIREHENKAIDKIFATKNLYPKDMIDIQSFMWEIKILENKI